MEEKIKVIHPLDPIIGDGARVLMLGSMPSPRSREVGFYYGHPQNRFWHVMSAVLGEPFPLYSNEKREMLIRCGIALWDVLESCEIRGAADSSIKNAIPNDIVGLVTGSDIRAVFLTGTAAFRFYERLLAKKVGLPYFCLPSTSPANAAQTMPALIERYSAILEYLK